MSDLTEKKRESSKWPFINMVTTKKSIYFFKKVKECMMAIFYHIEKY